jgi:hypothetical protein
LVPVPIFGLTFRKLLFGKKYLILDNRCSTPATAERNTVLY